MQGDGVYAPASKAWREGSSFRAISQEDSVCQVNIEGTIQGLGGNEVTSVVTSDVGDVVAFAHTDPYNSRTNTSGVSFSVKNADRLHALGHLKTPCGINDMCWTGRHLLAGTAGGSVLLYDTTHLDYEYNAPCDLADAVLLQHTIQFDHLSHMETGAPEAGAYLRSQRVNQVAMVPNNPTQCVPGQKLPSLTLSAVLLLLITTVSLDGILGIAPSRYSGMCLKGLIVVQEYNEVEDALPVMSCELDHHTGELCMLGTSKGAMRLKDFRIGAGTVHLAF